MGIIRHCARRPDARPTVMHAREVRESARRHSRRLDLLAALPPVRATVPPARAPMLAGMSHYMPIPEPAPPVVSADSSAYLVLLAVREREDAPERWSAYALALCVLALGVCSLVL